MPGDLLDDQDLRAVEHAELHGDLRGLVQVLQERQHRLAQLQPDRRQAGDLEQAVADAVPVARLFQPAEPDHPVGGPVRGRAGQPAPGDQRGQRELTVGGVERAEDRRRPVEPALGQPAPGDACPAEWDSSLVPRGHTGQAKPRQGISHESREATITVRTALIGGGAAGIGYAIAARLAPTHRVVITGRRAAALDDGGGAAAGADGRRRRHAGQRHRRAATRRRPRWTR